MGSMEPMAEAPTKSGTGLGKKCQGQRQAGIAKQWQRQVIFTWIRCAIVFCTGNYAAAQGIPTLCTGGHPGGEQHADPRQVPTLGGAGHHGPDQHGSEGFEYKAQTTCAHRTPQEGYEPQTRSVEPVQGRTIRDHLIKEQQRYEQEKSELGAALIQAQTDLDKMIKNGDEEMDAKDMEKPDVLAELLRTEAPKHSGGATMNHIPEEIKKTQEENRLLAQQMGELQQQMMYMVQAFTAPPMNASPSKAGLPPHLSTPVKSPQLRRSAIEPFSRANRQRDGPYTRGAEQPPGDPQKETQNVDSEEEEVMLAKADAYLQGSS